MDKCPRCGGKASKGGQKPYRGIMFQMRRCTKCGHYFKAEQITEG